MPDQVLLLRLDAPLMSFGAAMVDERGVVQAFPGLAMLTGLLGNALGYRHRDERQLERLQVRLRYACRCDRRGDLVRDYQTVDLGQEHMVAEAVGWTTRGAVAERKGGSAAKGTHIRFRDYWADAVFTVAMLLDPADEVPTLEQAEAALAAPARPLFIGRKCCLPASRVLLGRVAARSVTEALVLQPSLPAKRHPDPAPLSAWWFEDDAPPPGGGESRVVPVTDERDWHNQIHIGRRLMRHGLVSLPGGNDGL